LYMRAVSKTGVMRKRLASATALRLTSGVSRKTGAPGARAMSPANRRPAVSSSSANSGPTLNPSWHALKSP
jgi:hypothetical protein